MCACAHAHTHTQRGGHLGVLVKHDPAEQNGDDGDRDRDADDYNGVAFLGCLRAMVVTGLEIVVFAVRRGRKLAMHTQTTRNKTHRVVSCFSSLNSGICTTAFDKRDIGEAGFYNSHAPV